MSLDKSKRKVSKATIMPAVDPEVAQRHLAAYFFALYGNCECEACQLLRPVAKNMISNLKKTKGEVVESGGKEG